MGVAKAFKNEWCGDRRLGAWMLASHHPRWVNPFLRAFTLRRSELIATQASRVTMKGSTQSKASYAGSESCPNSFANFAINMSTMRKRSAFFLNPLRPKSNWLR